MHCPRLITEEICSENGRVRVRQYLQEMQVHPGLIAATVNQSMTWWSGPRLDVHPMAAVTANRKRIKEHEAMLKDPDPAA
jgi:hypothetical protein